MSKLQNERLYNLLPSVYRIRDASQGEPLRALLALIERELKHIEEDIDSLYDNWFIETCDEWVVPYIGDMLGVRNVRPAGSYSFSLRPYVANTLAYRRRKGTTAVLEQLSRDVTGWHAKAVEFFQLLSVTAHVKNVISSRGNTLDLRDSNNLELLNSPFENAAHTCQVRRISNRGKYNIPNIGIFLWRLQNYSVMRVTARSVSEHADGRYTFNPLGLDAPLFNRSRIETSITHLAEEINVPGTLRRRLLYDELENRRQALVDKKTPGSVYFGEWPVFQIFIDGQVISPEQILICNLGDFLLPGWLSPPQNKKYIHSNPDGTKDEQLLPIKVAVDPVLGRLAFPDGVIPGKVQVSYSYDFSDDIGGGPYNRQDSVVTWYNPLKNQHVTWQKGVTKDSETLDEAKEQLVQTLQDAVKEWNQHVANTPFAFGIIAIMDNSTYVEDLDIDIPPHSRLAIVAANWPAIDIEGQKQRINGKLVPDNLRPHIKGDLSVKTSGNLATGDFIMDGLLIEGKLTVKPGNLGRLQVAHCTLVPEHGGIIVEIGSTAGQQNASLDISIDHSICDSIKLPDTVPDLRIVNSIIDHAAGEAITGPGTSVSIQKSTVFGSSSMYSLEADNSIFTGIISVLRRQEGCMRFTYIPEGSRTPRRYRCQPDWLKPLFTSLRYGSPGYAQLHSRCPVEIQRGADDESEPGVFHDLFQMQRETDLRLSLSEYMRFGMEAGIFYVN